jgi:hypothetical protein
MMADSERFLSFMPLFIFRQMGLNLASDATYPRYRVHRLNDHAGTPRNFIGVHAITLTRMVDSRQV